MIKFSIILPVYNSENTISATIDSILNQNYSNYELLIIDDGSRDNSKNLILQYKDDRIFYFNQLNSGGPASPRNVGLKNAKGDWIAFIDSDDIWHPDKLTEISKISNINQYSLISHGTIMIDKINSKQFNHYPKISNLNFIDLLKYGNQFVLSSLLISNHFQKKYSLFFNESKSFKSVEDFQYIIDMCNTIKIHYYIVNKVLTTYLIHEQGISKDINSHIKNLKHLYNYNISKYKGKKLYYLKTVYICVINFVRFNISKEILKKPEYKYIIYSLIANPLLFIKKIIIRYK